jgi:hypothetical protein
MSVVKRHIFGINLQNLNIAQFSVQNVHLISMLYEEN